jgi:hypothetical protein
MARKSAAMGAGHSRADASMRLALVSEQPSANGVFRFELRKATESFSGEARVVFAQSRLNEAAQQDLRAAFPNDIPDAPVGPTFAQAERALDAAAIASIFPYRSR